MKWSVLGECVSGTSHLNQQIPCQDAFRFRRFGSSDQWLAIAVADGSGSASHSDIGATRACEELIGRTELLEVDSLFTHEGMVSLFRDVRQILLTEAERLEVPPREVACTALFAVIGPETAAFAQVGDGFIIIAQEPGYEVVFWPEPAEYANETDFLTDEEFADRIRFTTRTGPVPELAMLTDGLQRLALDFATCTPFSPFFQPFFRGLRAADDPESLVEPFRQFLGSKQVNERTDDDKTLVIATRRL